MSRPRDPPDVYGDEGQPPPQRLRPADAPTWDQILRTHETQMATLQGAYGDPAIPGALGAEIFDANTTVAQAQERVESVIQDTQNPHSFQIYDLEPVSSRERRACELERLNVYSNPLTPHDVRLTANSYHQILSLLALAWHGVTPGRLFVHRVAQAYALACPWLFRFNLRRYVARGTRAAYEGGPGTDPLDWVTQELKSLSVATGLHPDLMQLVLGYTGITPLLSRVRMQGSIWASSELVLADTSIETPHILGYSHRTGQPVIRPQHPLMALRLGKSTFVSHHLGFPNATGYDDVCLVAYLYTSRCPTLSYDENEEVLGLDDMAQRHSNVPQITRIFAMENRGSNHEPSASRHLQSFVRVCIPMGPQLAITPATVVRRLGLEQALAQHGECKHADRGFPGPISAPQGWATPVIVQGTHPLDTELASFTRALQVALDDFFDFAQHLQTHQITIYDELPILVDDSLVRVGDRHWAVVWPLLPAPAETPLPIARESLLGADSDDDEEEDMDEDAPEEDEKGVGYDLPLASGDTEEKRMSRLALEETRATSIPLMQRLTALAAGDHPRTHEEEQVVREGVFQGANCVDDVVNRLQPQCRAAWRFYAERDRERNQLPTQPPTLARHKSMSMSKSRR